MFERMHDSTMRWPRAKAGLSALAMLLLLATAPPLAATDYFVRQNGNDAAQRRLDQHGLADH